MLRRIGLLILLPAVIGQAVSCISTRPAAYASELKACEDWAVSWEQYTPCCANVARRYGRDPSFCLPPTDGGE
jgi:hypothetical protein